VRDILNRAGVEDRSDDALLVITELATNAVLHAGSPFHVDVWIRESEIRLGVTDQSPDLPIPQQRTSPDPGGNGVNIVSAVADKWVVEKLRTGKRIWVELRR
jgi:anti-sigma regulatory factor (Ser/Thr protein kinase)